MQRQFLLTLYKYIIYVQFDQFCSRNCLGDLWSCQVVYPGCESALWSLQAVSVRWSRHSRICLQESPGLRIPPGELLKQLVKHFVVEVVKQSSSCLLSWSLVSHQPVISVQRPGRVFLDHSGKWWRSALDVHTGIWYPWFPAAPRLKL